MNHEVAFCLTLLVQSLLDADSAHIDEFQDTGREQVVVVCAKVLIGVEHVVGLLQIALQRDVTIPVQVFVDLLAGTPDIDKIPDTANDRQYKEAQDEQDEVEDVFTRQFILAGIVAAFQRLFFLALKGIVFHQCRFEHAFVKAYHNI